MARLSKINASWLFWQQIASKMGMMVDGWAINYDASERGRAI